MSGSVRSLLVPAVAMATAGAIALSPVVVAPPTVTLAQPTAQLPSVYIADIQLAGIGVDIYQAIQPWVQYGVDLAIWATLWIPPVSSQIDILYYAGSLPLVSTTVYALADVVSNPLNFFGILGAYGAALGVIGYNFVAAELSWLGIPVPPLPPLPPIASADSSAAALASVRTARAPRAAAAVSLPAPVDEVVGEVAEVTVPVVEETPEVATEAATDLAVVTTEATEVAATSAPAEPVRGELRRSARAAVSSVRQTARAAAADVAAAAEQAVAEVTATVDAAAGEARSTARAARGAVTKAAQAASNATPD